MNIDLIGAVGFSDFKGHGFFRFLSRIIRFFTKGKWSHTYVIVGWIPNFNHLVEEAASLGVQLVSFDRYKGPKFEIELWRVKALPSQFTKGFQRIEPMVGKSYGYFQLLGFVLVWLWYKLTLRKANNPFRGGIICSELVLEYLKAVFPEDPDFSKLDRNTTSPEDLRLVFAKRPDLFELIPNQEPSK